MKKIFNLIVFFIFLGTILGCAHNVRGVRADNGKVANGDKGKEGETLLFPIKFYKDYISKIDGDRCPMYPTCSQYCSEAFKKHGTLLGWIMCSDRLVRCGRDETKISDPVWVDGEKHSYDPLSNNEFWRQ